MNSNCAIVTRITSIEPIPGADRIQEARVGNYTVVVSKEAQVGDIGIFFSGDLQLTHQFCVENDLFPRWEINESGGKVRVGGGYFDDKNRRVRAQKMRGVKSEGFFCSLDSVAYVFSGAGNLAGSKELTISKEDLIEGFTFNEINDVEICAKYYTPATLRAMSSGNGIRTKNGNPYFFEHADTGQLHHARIKDGSVITVTAKLHGTSHRSARVWETVNCDQSIWERIARRVLPLYNKRPVSTKVQEVLICGTRRTVINLIKPFSYYGQDDSMRATVHTSFAASLMPGETVYGEIVGFLPSGGPIMSDHNNTNLKDKAVVRQYGAKMRYSYGCEPTEHDFYVYRMTRISLEGEMTELPWSEVKIRCAQMGVKFVPELLVDVKYIPIELTTVDKDLITAKEGKDLITAKEGKITTVNKVTMVKQLVTIDQEGSTSQFVYDQGVDVAATIEHLLDVPDSIDPRHVREGVVLRIDAPDRTVQFVKAKSYLFKVLEGNAKESEDLVDLEEIS